MRKAKRINVVALVLCLIFIMSSCSKGVDSASVQEFESIVFVDGSEISVPSEIKTYATLSPSYTETLLDLGFENEIVTIDNDSTYLSVYSNNISIFDKSKLDLNHKILLESKPEVILLENETFVKFTKEEVQQLMENGSTFIVLPIPKTIQDIRKELDFIVRLTKADYGVGLLADFDLKYDRILKYASQVKERPVVFMQLIDKKNIKTMGKNTWQDMIIELAGGRNAFSDRHGYIYVTYEDIAMRNPNYYFAISTGNIQEAQIINNNALSETVAIKNEDVYIFEETQMLNPNHRCLDAVNTLGFILHRDIYK